MPVSKSQKAATARFEAKAYDKTLVRMPKGHIDIIKAHATSRGETLNGFINRSIDETMQRDNDIDQVPASSTEQNKPAPSSKKRTDNYMMEALNRQMREGIGIKEDEKAAPETEVSSANTEPVSRLTNARKPERRST